MIDDGCGSVGSGVAVSAITVLQMQLIFCLFSLLCNPDGSEEASRSGSGIGRGSGSGNGSVVLLLL